ncbi:MAG: cytochrome c biogenesis protein CcdA [Paraglaciecola sp.]|jgi:cytochrome c biogenesis protein CcdA
MNKLLVILLLFLSSFSVSAQSDVAMADGLRSEGKIYIVVAVVLIILIGVFVQLFRIEKKVKKLEDENS